MANRYLIIGASGQLGTAIRNIVPESEYLAPSHQELSLEDANSLEHVIVDFKPTVVINCSAFHHVDTCERQPEQAIRVNGLAVDSAAAICEKHEILFVTVSTDYVFDGRANRPYTEYDSVNPLTAYGASKAVGEFLTRRHGGRHLIIRTSGVFGTTGSSSKGYSLIDRLLKQAEDGISSSMVDDMRFSPSFAPHLARTLLDLISVQAYGTYHVTNSGECSWYEFVRYAFDKAGYSRAALEPISYATYQSSVRRPLYSPLASNLLQGLNVTPMPSWTDAVDEYLALRLRKKVEI